MNQNPYAVRNTKKNGNLRSKMNNLKICSDFTFMYDNKTYCYYAEWLFCWTPALPDWYICCEHVDGRFVATRNAPSDIRLPETVIDMCSAWMNSNLDIPIYDFLYKTLGDPV